MLNKYLFNFINSFENLNSVANGTEISSKSFQKFRKLLNFEMQTTQPQILEIPGAKLNRKTTFGTNFENLGIPREVVLFFGNFGKCCSICYWKLPKIQTGILVEWKAPSIYPLHIPSGDLIRKIRFPAVVFVSSNSRIISRFVILSFPVYPRWQLCAAPDQFIRCC